MQSAPSCDREGEGPIGAQGLEVNPSPPRVKPWSIFGLFGLTRNSALYGLNLVFQNIQEAGTVLIGKARMKGLLSRHFPDMAVQVPHPKRHAYRFVGEFVARRTQNNRTILQAARGKRNVRRDSDIGRSNVLRDPIIRGIGAFGDDDMFHLRIGARTYSAVADDMHGQAMTIGHAHDLFLDGTGIGIDEDFKQKTSSADSNRIVLVPADGFAQELGGIGEIKLVFDPRAISLDRLDADLQAGGDAARIHA